MKRTAAVMLLIACIPATYNAGVRRFAETKRAQCQFADHKCYELVKAYCVSKHLESTCGDGVVYKP